MNGAQKHISDVTARRRRRRRFVYGVALCAAFITLGAVAVWIFAESPMFRITEISIEGTALVSRDDISNLLRGRIAGSSWWKPFFGSDNILIWPRTLAGADTVFFPEIRRVDISKNYFARTVSVRVAERTPIGIWCYRKARTDADTILKNADNTQDNAENFQRLSAFSPRESASSCKWFDGKGIMFKRSPSSEGGLIAVVRDYSQESRGLGSAVLPDRLLANFLAVIAALRESKLSSGEIILTDLAREEIEIRNYGVIDDPAGSSNTKNPPLYFSIRFPVKGVRAVIERLTANPGLKNLQYIDFRVENKVYYR